MVKYLREVSGLELTAGEDRVQLMQSMGDIATFSGAFPGLRAGSQQDRQ
jgi:hypothetical protein